MDFNDTPEQAAFREAAASWLAANVPSKDEIKGLKRLEVAKLWQKRKYDAGWACIGWDPAYGGRGASAIEQVIWKQEEGKYDVPAGFFVIGQGMMAPTLMAYAQPQYLDQFLPKLASGEEIVPFTTEKEEHVFGYYPIVTNDMCLKCHGDIGEIDEAAHSKIQLLYPEDKATGYSTNQLRGIWVVKMMK